MMKAYCPQCDTERPLKEVRRQETYKVRGEEIVLTVTVPVCSSCGETVSLASRDDAILDEVYREYRQRKGLLQPEEIAGLRARYGLSQRALAKLMGWGLVTVQRYEAGNLQDVAHDTLLRHLNDPDFVLEMVAKNAANLSRRECELVRETALNWAEATADEDLAADFERWVHRKAQRDRSLVGWQDFTVERVAQVISWLGAHTRQLTKTKLAKLLWLADFAHFRRERRSITGLVYARVPYGPMPDGFQALLGALEAVGHIRLEPVVYSKGEGEIVQPPVDSSPEALTPAEIETLRRVVRRYGALTSRQLSDLSHAEPIWTERMNSELIPYPEAEESPLIQGLSE